MWMKSTSERVTFPLRPVCDNKCINTFRMLALGVTVAVWAKQTLVYWLLTVSLIENSHLLSWTSKWVTREVCETHSLFSCDCGFGSRCLECALPFKLAHQIVKPLAKAFVSVKYSKINHEEGWQELWGQPTNLSRYVCFDFHKSGWGWAPAAESQLLCQIKHFFLTDQRFLWDTCYHISHKVWLTGYEMRLLDWQTSTFQRLGVNSSMWPAAR